MRSWGFCCEMSCWRSPHPASPPPRRNRRRARNACAPPVTASRGSRAATGTRVPILCTEALNCTDALAEGSLSSPRPSAHRRRREARRMAIIFPRGYPRRVSGQSTNLQVRGSVGRTHFLKSVPSVSMWQPCGNLAAKSVPVILFAEGRSAQFDGEKERDSGPVRTHGPTDLLSDRGEGPRDLSL